MLNKYYCPACGSEETVISHLTPFYKVLWIFSRFQLTAVVVGFMLGFFLTFFLVVRVISKVELKTNEVLAAVVCPKK